MKFSVVTAWKDMGDPYRAASFAYTRRYWERHFPEAELVVASPEPFTRARGLNVAVAAARHAVVLQADPDTIAPRAQVWEAVRLAAASEGLVVPYTSYLYLDEYATERLHDAPLSRLPTFSAADCEFAGVGGAGPLTAYSRETWKLARGYDERFGLWGGDDAAFAYACDAFTGVPTRRVEGSVLHSYHPRLEASIPGSPAYLESMSVLSAYRDAAAVGPDAVRAVVEAR